MTRVEIALKLAPSFRERFDFSTDEDFKKWLDLTMKAADVFAKELSDEEKSHQLALAKITALEKQIEALNPPTKTQP